MNGALISVIVPVYNVEKYLERCIQSIIRQTYTNLEIILIDDGSTDKCPQMCDEYARNDRRIKVIHQRNMGVSRARNGGLEICSGELLSFVDSDDFLDGTFFQRMIFLMDETGCNIAQCDYEIGKNDFFSDDVEVNISILKREESLQYKNMRIAVWGRLYKTKSVGSLRFPEGKIAEDTFYTYKAIYESGDIATTNEKLYYYFQSEGSLSRDPNNRLNFDNILGHQERLKYFLEKKDIIQIDLSYEALLYGYFLSYYNCYRYKGVDLKKILKEYRRCCRLYSWKNATFSQKIKLRCFAIFPNITCYAFKLKLKMLNYLMNRR